VEHEYERAGALALLAALDVRTGKVFASTAATTGTTPFMDLIGQVMIAGPCTSTPRVFVIVDNGSDHRGDKAAQRLRDAYPNAIMIHTPVHASWLNQAEIIFSTVQKKLLTPTTSPAPPSSPLPCWLSSTVTTRPPGPSTGSSPPPTWPGSSSESATARNPPPCQRPPDTPDELMGSPTKLTRCSRAKARASFKFAGCRWCEGRWLLMAARGHLGDTRQLCVGQVLGGSAPSHDRTFFRPDVSPSCDESCECAAPVADACRRPLLLLSPLLSAHPFGGQRVTKVPRRHGGYRATLDYARHFT
jgi:DDE superfamily endonuclease